MVVSGGAGGYVGKGLHALLVVDQLQNRLHQFEERHLVQASGISPYRRQYRRQLLGFLRMRQQKDCHVCKSASIVVDQLHNRLHQFEERHLVQASGLKLQNRLR